MKHSTMRYRRTIHAFCNFALSRNADQISAPLLPRKSRVQESLVQIISLHFPTRLSITFAAVIRYCKVFLSHALVILMRHPLRRTLVLNRFNPLFASIPGSGPASLYHRIRYRDRGCFKIAPL
jgi:hypothetical protein